MSPSDSRVRAVTEPSTRAERSGGLDLLTWGLFDHVALDAVVTGRSGGTSAGRYSSLNLALHVGDDPAAVIENRWRAVAALEGSLDQLVVADQVHGREVAVVGTLDAGRGSRSRADAVRATDALVTTTPGLVLAILVADCAPLVLFDPEAGVLGCAHAGWRGALGGVIESTLEAMTGLGADRGRILAGIGPTIDARSYEVGDEVLRAAVRHLGVDHGCGTPNGTGRSWFDLRVAVRTSLLRAGLEAPHIAVATESTGPDGPYFSARSEGVCGRFALLARIRP